MRFRRAVPADDLAPLLDAMMELALKEDPFWIAGEGAVKDFIVADSGGELVGVLGVTALPHGYWYAAPLYVIPEARSRGVAHGMMREAARQMSEEGHNQALTTASPATFPLYSDLGFSEIAKTMRWSHA